MKKLFIAFAMVLGILLGWNLVGTTEPSYQVVGIKNASGTQVSPALESGNLQTAATCLSFVAQTTSLAAAASGTTLTLLSPISSHAFEVSTVGGTLVDIDSTLEGSLDGVNFSRLLTCSLGAQNTVQWVASKPVTYLRVRLVMLTLGDATGVQLFLVGK